ncbi:MAG: Uncharacterized protein G01um10147_904 [Microgenomates group bacterium Gr01-1014_7]|nr:MAG: Uncharacterized protein G01um10147_904 [Microgenomates group bacterium Gr01-1014_7]
MSYLPFAILAQFLNSIAVTVDKILLTKTIPDPLIYIFYFSLMNMSLLLGIPFVKLPSTEVIMLASVSTASWIIGAYLMLRALKSGQVQRVIPVIGALTPIFLLILGFQGLTQTQIKAIAILVAGLIFLTLENLKGKINMKELFLEIFSSVFFALSYYFLSLSFLKTSFLTVLIWSRPILLPLLLSFLVVPYLRRIIASFLKTKAVVKSVPLFIFGQVSAIASELLLLFSISLANPAIVNSLQGIKYIFLIVFSLILGTKFPEVFKLKFSGYFLLTQIIGIGFITIGLYLLASTG